MALYTKEPISMETPVDEDEDSQIGDIIEHGIRGADDEFEDEMSVDDEQQYFASDPLAEATDESLRKTTHAMQRRARPRCYACALAST